MMFRQAGVQAGGGAAMSPYLHQLYAANPYIHPNILNLATMGAQGKSKKNSIHRVAALLIKNKDDYFHNNNSPKNLNVSSKVV